MIKDDDQVKNFISSTQEVVNNLNVFKIDSLENDEARECLEMILVAEHNEQSVTNQLGDNFRNLLLSLKQVHLKHTD